MMGGLYWEAKKQKKEKKRYLGTRLRNALEPGWGGWGHILEAMGKEGGMESLSFHHLLWPLGKFTILNS